MCWPMPAGFADGVPVPLCGFEGEAAQTEDPSSYSWPFISDTGAVLDTGTQACH
jgi:hypothetical protein